MGMGKESEQTSKKQKRKICQKKKKKYLTDKYSRSCVLPCFDGLVCLGNKDRLTERERKREGERDKRATVYINKQIYV